MACLRCGKIQEFESHLFERLKGQVERECRFHIVVTRVEIGGYCSACRVSGTPTDRPIPMHTGEAYDNPGTALVPAMKLEDFTMTSISPAV